MLAVADIEDDMRVGVHGKRRPERGSAVSQRWSADAPLALRSCDSGEFMTLVAVTADAFAAPPMFNRRRADDGVRCWRAALASAPPTEASGLM